jgi:hypothetical protein
MILFQPEHSFIWLDAIANSNFSAFCGAPTVNAQQHRQTASYIDNIHTEITKESAAWSLRSFEQYDTTSSHSGFKNLGASRQTRA